MAGTDLVQRTKDTVAVLETPDFLSRVEPLLPDTVPLRRFVQVAKTAIRANPDLAACDQRSLFNAIIRCAEAGLYPNNEDAALVPYKGKVTFIPMVDGVRKIAAEYGWTIKARVAFSEDEFDYTEEPPAIRHRPVRPGMERGDRIAAYATATHRDGRKLFRVLDSDEIAKRRAKAQTTRVWDEFPDAMWMKSAVHALFDEIPRAERDLMIRLDAVDETTSDDAVDALYGPDGTRFLTTPAAPSSPDALAQPPDGAEVASPHATPGTGGGSTPQQAASADSTPADAVPGADDDPEPQPDWVNAGTAVVEKGNWAGRSIAEVAAVEAGREWIAWALPRPGSFDPGFHEALVSYVEGALPELWAAHTERQAA